MTTYSDIAKRLLSFDSREFGTGASDEEINAAEQALGARIEGGYRMFLKQFGWGGVEHIEIYGLGPEIPPYLNIIKVTQSERDEMEPCLQRHLIPVMNDGGGNLYCIDTSIENEPTVVFWDHTRGADQIPVIEGESFASWLAEQLDGLDE